MLSLWSII